MLCQPFRECCNKANNSLLNLEQAIGIFKLVVKKNLMHMRGRSAKLMTSSSLLPELVVAVLKGTMSVQKSHPSTVCINNNISLQEKGQHGATAAIPNGAHHCPVLVTPIRRQQQHTTKVLLKVVSKVGKSHFVTLIPKLQQVVIRLRILSGPN